MFGLSKAFLVFAIVIWIDEISNSKLSVAFSTSATNVENEKDSFKSSRPNIIFIMADDLGWNDVSFHGSYEIPTPNIDALANRGIILNNYYVAPICSPSRSAFLTGKHPIHTGMQVDVIYGSQPYGLGLSEKLISEHLNDLGYVSHVVGKWHQGFFRKEYTPTYRGFQSHFGYYCGHQDYYTHTAEEAKDVIGFDMRRNMNLTWNTAGSYSTRLFTEEAVRIVQEHDKMRPLFLFLSQIAVHVGNSYDPIQAPANYVNRFAHIKDEKRRKFAGVLTVLDESVANITLALNSRGMLDNSIIVFTTDNGGAAGGFNNNAASNWPLKGTKDTLWEGGVRGSAMIYSRLLRRSSVVSTQLMTIEDWLPTLYSAAGGNVRDLGPKIDGIDMWDALNSGSQESRTEILHNIDDVRNISAIRVGNYKLVLGRTYGGRFDGWFQPPQTGRRQSYNLYESEMGVLDSLFGKPLPESVLSDLRLKATVDCGPMPLNASKSCDPNLPCLYDVVSDPCEFYNVASDHKDVVAQLTDRLLFYRSTAVAPRNKPFDPASYPVKHGYAWVPWRP